MKNTTIFKRLLGYLKAYRLRLFFVLLSAVISTAFMVLAPFLVGKVTTTLFASIADKVFYWETIIWLLAALVALYFVSQLFSFLQGFGMAKITANVMQTIRREIDEKMHRLKLNYYDVHTHGDILSVTSQEAATSDFYKTSMTLNEETWNLSLVPMKGYPELKGMEKREVISVKTAEDFMKMKDFPTQEYRLKADIDLSGTEQTGSVIPEFSGVLDGENHKITGLKAPLFGQLSGTVSNVAIDAGAIEIGNNVDTTVGIFANTMTITAQKVFADAELNIPYTVSTQNTAAFIGQASEDSKIQYSTAAGGVYPEDPSSTRYKLTHMDNSSNLNELKAFTNCFINTDTPGYDSIANDPKGVTHEALCGTEFYTNEMRLSQDVWDLSDVAGTGTPSLKTMPEEDVRAPETAPTPEEEIPMQETAPEGYTEIRTAEELLAIRDSSDKYILMSSISLYDAEPQDGSFLGDFKGELNGNGLTIREVYGAPLFNTLSGKVENLKLTDVKVEAWSQNQGANAFAKTLSGATVSKVALKNILVAGGNNTGALAGTAQNSTVSEVWAEGLNVNPYGPIHGQNDAMVGGLIAKLKGGCHISDSYVGGEITVNGETQGGVFGYNSNMDNGPENTVKQVVSNMKTKAISGQTDGAGFIGMIGYDYSWSTWMKNSIAIGEAGVSSDHGSVGQAYRFATKGNSESPIRFGLQNCYEANVSGRSSVVSGYLDETGRYKETSFYQDTLKFDSSKWNFTSVEKKGHPTLSWVADAEPLPPLPEGSAVTTHKQLKTEVPQGYTAIRTPADFMKIAENPSGKYILMNNISLEQVKLAEGQTSYIMKRFEGELDGNNQVIHGLRASLFDSISGTSSKKAVVKNLRVQNVFVNAGYKDIFDWQGKPVLAEANGLAREVSNGRLETIYMNCVKLNGGGNTGALGGLVNETYIGKVWLEGIDINSGLSEEELGRFNLVGGAVGSLSGYNSKFEDSYVEGKIIMDNNQQGGVAGQVKAAVVRNVISNVEARSNKPDSWTEKSGFVGDVNTSLQYDNRWYLDRCISIGNSGNNYKFLGKDLKAVTKNNLNLCYEVTGKTGRSNVTDATSQSGTLLTIDNINNVELYRDTLSFNDNTAQADPNAWDFSSVAEKGYPTLTWLLTYDGAAATMVEQTPVQDQEQEAAQDENLAEAEVNLPEQDEYLKED